MKRTHARPGFQKVTSYWGNPKPVLFEEECIWIPILHGAEVLASRRNGRYELTGTNVEGTDFLTPSRTILLSRYGAKIRCEEVMRPGQEITIYHLDTGEYCLAKIVGLYDRLLSGGYAYGVEFLDQDRDFWRVEFKVSGDTEIRIPYKSSQREPRRRKVVRVMVYGTDRRGNPFSQTAHSMNVSRSGACLEGVGFLTDPGGTIDVKRGWKKARYRVVWVGKRGTSRAGQVGLLCLEPQKNIWKSWGIALIG